MKTRSQSRRKQPHSGIQVKRDVSARIAGHDRNQFVHQITIHLEERPRADLILVLLGSIANCRRARLRQRFRIDRRFVFYSPPKIGAAKIRAPSRPAPRSEKRHPADFRQLALQRLRPAQQISSVSLAPAECPGQQTFIRRVREQLNLFNCRRAVQSAELQPAAPSPD